ncbi:hypothetical protein MMC10_004289 [Thelotrema lepadinum]|nr:hypothetical protein [Thelotrema lepadinum]
MANQKIVSFLKVLEKYSCIPLVRQAIGQKPKKGESPNEAPEATPNDKPYEKEIRDYFDERRKNMKIMATTTTPMGQTVDWIPVESQGTIASPPPKPAPKSGDNVTFATPELAMDGAQKGPEGTVPVLRKNLDGLKFDEPLEKFLNKLHGTRRTGKQDSTLSAQAGGVHRYGSSQQAVTCYGGSGTLSYWNPAVQTNGDFSLLQTGMINTQQVEQTAEAGWQVFQALNGDTGSHLFTYYTTNGYASSGNNVGGYDTSVTGWVQVDGTVFPGTVFSPYSSREGSQYAMGIQYQLYQGNWWLAVNGTFIGYYPASLYAKNGTTANTLGDHATDIGWWGEVYDDQSEAGGRTTTDMGSGQFPSGGWQQSAYMNNLTYQSDAGGTQTAYNGANGIVQEDPDMYQIQGQWNSGTTWGSYAWVGGPGAG